MSEPISHSLIRELFEKGYTVIDGKVISPLTNKELTLQKKKDGYLFINHRSRDGMTRSAMIHRLVAYKKYGEEMFKEGLEVRHLDNNQLNNLENNIALGTRYENSMDRVEEDRKRSAIYASSFIKVHDHKAIIKRRKQGARPWFAIVR